MFSKSALLRWGVVPVAGAAGYFGAYKLTPFPRPGPLFPGTVLVRDGSAAAKENKNGKEKEAARLDAARAHTPEFAEIGQWVERLSRCAAADLPAVLAEILALPDEKGMNEEKSWALRLLGARWADVDPEGGFELLFKTEETATAGRYLLAEWARRDPVATLAACEKLGEEDRNSACFIIGDSLLEDGPEVFWAWFKVARKPLPMFLNDKWRPVLEGHLEEWLAMVDTAAKEPGEEALYPRHFYQTLARVLAERDPGRAVAWVKNLPEEVKIMIYFHVLEGVVESSPEKAADYPELLRGGRGGMLEINRLLGKAARAMVDRDLTGAVRWLADRGQRRDLLVAPNAIGDGLGRAVSEGRMTSEQAVAAAESTGDHARNVMERLCADLPADFLAKMAAGNSDAGSGTLEAVVGAWGAKDPEAAMRFAESLEDGKLRSLLFENFVGSSAGDLVESIPARTVAALEKIPVADRAAVLTEHLARYQYGNEEIFGQELASAVAGLPDSEDKTNGVRRILEKWGANDPRSAVAWAAGLAAEDSSREAAVTAAVRGWAGADAWGASQWIDAQPPGETRDMASQSLAAALAHVEPASAWDWARSVGDPARRAEAMEPVLRSWAAAAPEEAGAALEEAAGSLPEADRARLAAILQEHGKSSTAGKQP